MKFIIHNSYFIIYFSLFTFHFSIAQNNSHFDRLTVDDGLLQNNIIKIIQDRQGFLWFGCYNGLNRYDGYSFTIYQHNPTDSTSLSDNLIKSLYEDEEGIIWVGTSAGGLNLYNPDLDAFSRLRLITDQGDESSHIQDITGDRNGTVFIATTSGLFVYNKKTGKLSYHNPVDEIQVQLADIYGLHFVGKNSLLLKSLSNFYVYNLKNEQFSLLNKINELNSEFKFSTFKADSEGRYWAGTIGNGLFSIDIEKHGKPVVENYRFDKIKASGIGSNHINQIFIDAKNRVWVVTDIGIDIYDSKSREFTHIYKQGNSKAGPDLNNINDLFVDSTGIVWIGTQGGGIYIIDDKKIKFKQYTHDDNNQNTVAGKVINAFYEEASGNLWIGTWNNGLSYFNRSKNTFTHYQNNPVDKRSLNSNRVRSILEDSKQNIWVATQNGINRFDRTTKTFKQYNETSITYSIFLDSKNNLWICGGGLGVGLYNDKLDSFLFSNNMNSNIHSNYPTCMVEDKNNNFWIGCYGSLVYYNAKKDSSFVYTPNNVHPDKSISHQNITCLLYDSIDRLWIGTEGGGLNLYHPENNSFTHYRMSDGLSSEVVCAILEDNNKNIWISTLNGISKFYPEKRIFKNFTTNEGLQNKEFKLRSAFKLKSGEMVFGGVNGYNIFQPENITENLIPPSVVITDFQLLYKSVKIKPRGASNSKEFFLDKHISATKKIKLSHKQNFITFQFTAINFTLPEKNQYACILDGFEEDWHYLGIKREVTYTNIPPGEYVFRVKASNNDGVWNEEGASIKVIIRRPFWRTPLAYLIYVVFMGFIIFLLRKIIQKEENIRVDLKYEKLEAQKAQELFNMKMQFFTNISHEIRTPLTLIVGPTEKIINYHFEDQDLNNQINTINRNAKSLLRLVNQLLDFRKLETGHLKLEAEWGEIMGYFLQIKQLFNSQAEAKLIDFSYDFYPQQLWCYFDPDKMEKILYNLLSNAFKFNNNKRGKVDLVVRLIYIEQESENGGMPSEIPFLRIQVKDNGAGISTENQSNIFTRFYQVSMSEGKNYSGSGIGLSFTRQIVQLMGGDISFESKVGMGSTFVVKIPLVLKNESTENDFHKTVNVFKPLTPPEDIIFDEAIENSTDNNNDLILIIEDNIDVCNYIVGELKEEYCTMVAHDGEEGWTKTINKMPGLVICDIMMPVMDGLAYCTKIKNERLTSHIPVILLTARLSEVDKLQGLETGADDYITKPFSTVLLKARIKNLLENRRKIKERFGYEIDILPSEVTVTSLDEEFLSSAINIVTEHLSEVEFSIEQLCSELGVSRTNLHVKLKAITGMSSSIFIRVIRLKQATRFLKSGRMNISEVAFNVGFNDPKYFSKCFKEHFNVLPTDYAKSVKDINFNPEI